MYWFTNINPNAIQPWSKMTGDLASSERMRKSFGVSPESASTSDQMCASSHKSDSKVIALHLKNSWKPHITCDFKLTHPLCKPFHHCLWWSIHLAKHWLRSSDGKDSVLYCSQAEVETSWLGTNREENADSIIPDPEPDCPPVMPIVVVRISWKHFDSRKIITQSLEQVFFEQWLFTKLPSKCQWLELVRQASASMCTLIHIVPDVENYHETAPFTISDQDLDPDQTVFLYVFQQLFWQNIIYLKDKN